MPRRRPDFCFDCGILSLRNDHYCAIPAKNASEQEKAEKLRQLRDDQKAFKEHEDYRSKTLVITMREMMRYVRQQSPRMPLRLCCRRAIILTAKKCGNFLAKTRRNEAYCRFEPKHVAVDDSHNLLFNKKLRWSRFHDRVRPLTPEEINLDWESDDESESESDSEELESPAEIPCDISVAPVAEFEPQAGIRAASSPPPTVAEFDPHEEIATQAPAPLFPNGKIASEVRPTLQDQLQLNASDDDHFPDELYAERIYGDQIPYLLPDEETAEQTEKIQTLRCRIHNAHTYQSFSSNGTPCTILLDTAPDQIVGDFVVGQDKWPCSVKLFRTGEQYGVIAACPIRQHSVIANYQGNLPPMNSSEWKAHLRHKSAAELDRIADYQMDFWTYQRKYNRKRHQLETTCSRWHVDASETPPVAYPGRLINYGRDGGHSNCKTIGRLLDGIGPDDQKRPECLFIASRAIRQGEQILVDYGRKYVCNKPWANLKFCICDKCKADWPTAWLRDGPPIAAEMTANDKTSPPIKKPYATLKQRSLTM